MKFYQQISKYTAKIVALEVGVLLAIKDSIISTILPSLTEIEMLSVKVELSQTTTYLMCCIFTPNPTLLQIQFLSHHLSQFPTSFDLILLDDFNLPNVNWKTLSGTSAIDDAFCDVF